MATAIEVARAFLRLAADEPDEPELITHLRLQKLLYYAQGLSLAYRERPLFGERIEAWVHGPVVPDVFPAFADYGSAPISPHEARGGELGDEDEEFVASVWEGYRRYSATALRRMTHGEAPWREARRGLTEDSPSRREITPESLRDYFTKTCDEKMRQESGLSLQEMRETEADFRAGRTRSWEEVKRRLGPTISH